MNDDPKKLKVDSLEETMDAHEFVQLVSDVANLRCRVCSGAKLTVTNEEPVHGLPVISYVCRECGFHSKRPESDKDRGLIDRAWARIESSGVQVDQVWRHNKTSSFYRVVALSVDEVKLVPVVTYEGIPDAARRSWTRDLDVFTGKREDGAPRFTLVPVEIVRKAGVTGCERCGATHIEHDQARGVSMCVVCVVKSLKGVR